MKQRLNELETRLAFQENTVDTLNEVIIRQQQQLDRLEQEFIRLTTRLRPLLAAADELPGA